VLVERAAALVGVALIAVLATGCGGGRLSLVDFEAKANGICAKYNAKIRAAYTSAPPDFASLALAIRKAIGYAKKGNAELDKLKPPKSYDSQYKEFLRINHQEVPAATEFAKAAESRDQARLLAARTRLVLLGRDADRLARNIGLNTCAQH
jgi:hypothetical protein